MKGMAGAMQGMMGGGMKASGMGGPIPRRMGGPTTKLTRPAMRDSRDGRHGLCNSNNGRLASLHQTATEPGAGNEEPQNQEQK
jgi:hypothetical protein